MSRLLTPAFKAAMAAGQVRVALFCEIMYESPVRMWTGRGSKVWDSKTFTGVGYFGGISAVQERAGTESNYVTLSLTGIPSEFLALALADTSQGKQVTVWLALLDSDWNIIDDPWRAVRGKTDVHKTTLGGKTGRIDVSVEMPNASLRRVRTFLYTHAEQQRIAPGDRIFENYASLDGKNLNWGVPGVAPVNSGGGSKVDSSEGFE